MIPSVAGGSSGVVAAATSCSSGDQAPPTGSRLRAIQTLPEPVRCEPGHDRHSMLARRTYHPTVRADDIRLLFAYDRWATRECSQPSRVWTPHVDAREHRRRAGSRRHPRPPPRRLQRWRVGFQTRARRGPRARARAAADDRRAARTLGNGVGRGRRVAPDAHRGLVGYVQEGVASGRCWCTS